MALVGRICHRCSKVTPSFYALNKRTAAQKWRPFCSGSSLADEEDEKKGSLLNLIGEAQKRRQAYEDMIKKEEIAYERGKRHLAHMMGEDPETFTQADVDRAISYLLPSGLFDKRARPMLKPPQEYYPPLKAAAFGADGRPFNFLFYTGKPAYYELMHEFVKHMNKVIDYADRMRKGGMYNPEDTNIDMSRSEWVTKAELETMIIEELSDTDYEKFINILERIVELPYSNQATSFVVKYRKELAALATKEEAPPIQYDANGRPFTEADGLRKSASATVRLLDHGTGKITINGRRFLDHFVGILQREEVIFPLSFVNMVDRFDLECQVEGGGPSGQSGAIRFATAKALRSFVSQDMTEKMRQAGLLTRDVRIKERQKPGQRRARRKFQWNKR